MRTLRTLRSLLLPLLLLCPAAARAQERWGDLLTSVALSPDGERAATGSFNRLVMLWNEATRSELSALRGHYSYVYAVAFSRDGRTLASGGGDMLRLWDVGERRLSGRLDGHEATITALAFSPDGRTLASGDHFGNVALWEYATGQRLRVLEQGGPPASRLAFSADGKFLASGGDGGAFVWEVATGRRLGHFRDKRFVLGALALSPDGSTAAVAGCALKFLKTKCSVRVWDAATGRELRSLDVPSELGGLAFSRDGKLLAGVGPTAAPRLWEAATGALAATLEEVRGGFPYALAFDDGGQKLTGTYAFTDRPPGRVVWDVAARKLAAPLARNLPPMKPEERPGDATAQPSPTAAYGGLDETQVGVGPGRGQSVAGGRGAYRAAEVTTQARITHKPEAAYTELARKNLVVGKVRLRAVLKSDGTVGDIQVRTQLPYFLTDEAVRAARAIRFVPATKDGRAVSQYITLDYNFNIY